MSHWFHGGLHNYVTGVMSKVWVTGGQGLGQYPSELCSVRPVVEDAWSSLRRRLCDCLRAFVGCRVVVTS